MKQLILRTVHPSGKSSNGFVWPLTVGATASAPDWNPEATCGNGLHGWLFGCGNPDVAEFDDTYLWLVLEVEELVDLKGKVKFPSAVVQFVGSRKEAIDYMVERTPAANLLPINWREENAAGYHSTMTAGDYSTLTAGYHSTLTAGYYSTLTAGDYSTLTAGYHSTLTAGDESTLTAGYHSTLTAGRHSTLTAGHNSTLTAGHYSTLTAGYHSTLTAGHYSTLTAGDYSTLTAGHNSTMTAGDESTLTAGDESTLTAGHYSTLTAGDYSTLTAGYESTIKAGANSIIIIIIHYPSGPKTYHVGTDLLPDTAYIFKNGSYELA